MSRSQLFTLLLIIVALTFPVIIIMTGGDINIEDKQSLCFHKLLTGIPCAGCGITKSFVSIYKGNIPQSIHFHALGPTIFITLILLLFKILIETATNIKIDFSRFKINTKSVFYALAVLLTVYHIFRLVLFISTHTFNQIIQESIWG